MDLYSDQRIVLTLDAGGTNFVFSAIQGGKEISKPVHQKAEPNNLDKCLQNIFKGFGQLMEDLPEKPSAISFAFPGPADYPNGIIGDLGNLPAFRGGVPLKSILENQFKIPVFINNDGDLYAYGEAIAGILPEINQLLKENGNPKQYKNLVGLTLGTGFGAGIVRNGELFLGDNSLAGEVWIMSQRHSPAVNMEEVISTRAIVNTYRLFSGDQTPDLMPKDIFSLVISNDQNKASAAKKAFSYFGECLGDVIANLMTIFDGIVVIGGGLTGASELYMPSVMASFNNSFIISPENSLNRLVQKVYNLDNAFEKQEFVQDRSKTIIIPGTTQTISYDPAPRLAVATSKLGASNSISLGAYAFAIRKLDTP